MKGSEINFSLALRGTPHMAMEVGQNGIADINICITVDEVIQLFCDCLSEWDMLTEEQKQSVRDIRNDIRDTLEYDDAERRCMNCDEPRACVNCENFAKIHGQA